MSRAQPNRSPTDQHATRIGAAIAKGRVPAFTAGFQSYLESSPREIFAAFEGAARHMPPAGKDESLALGYLFVLQGLLEHLRYRTDCGHRDAARLIADFQADIAARAEAGHIDGRMLACVGGALHQSKIPVSPEFAAISAKQCSAEDESTPLPHDLGAATIGILEMCGGDPFALAHSLSEFGHALTSEARGALAACLARSGNADGRAAAVLFLLDLDSAVRHAAADALGPLAASLSPTEIRRLIAIRNWRPASERAAVDAIIRKARAAGVVCAQWPAGSADAISATAIDGAEAQAILVVSPAGRKKRLSSILFKRGIADAWTGDPESRRRIEATTASADAPMLAVSRSYLDRVVAHGLAVSVDKGEVPPFGLLQVAEAIGGADWQPARMEFGETLAGLIGAIPKTMRSAAAVAAVLRGSGEFAELEFVAQSWFEDDPQIAEFVAGTRGVKRAKLATHLLQSVIARRRDKWADLLLRTALWMREAPPEADLCWRELAIVAKALADGRDMTEIGLMRDVALRTIAVLRDAAPV